MNVIICLDDKNGIQFNHRRQSRDQAVCDRMLELAKDSALWMDEYSAKMFPAGQVKVAQDFLQKAGPGEYCFVENDTFLRHYDKVEKVIVYRWNKVYPADMKIESSFFDRKNLAQKCDFAGNSHEKITEEIYQ